MSCYEMREINGTMNIKVEALLDYVYRDVEQDSVAVHSAADIAIYFVFVEPIFVTHMLTVSCVGACCTIYLFAPTFWDLFGITELGMKTTSDGWQSSQSCKGG